MQKVMERILNLLAFLLTVGRPVTADEIRHTVKGYEQPTDEAFRRTFERDKDLLRSLGVPLELRHTDVWEVELGYFVPEKSYTLDDPGLTDEERSALLLAAEAVRFGGRSTEAAAIFKLGGSPSTNRSSPVLADLGQDLEDLGNLFSAVAEGRTVRFPYKGTTRVLRPYGLVHRFGHWYLVGPEKGSEQVKAFRVDRMGPFTVGEEAHAFVRPAGFNPSIALAGVDEPEPTMSARILFDPSVAAIAMSQRTGVTELGTSEDGVVLSVPYEDGDSLVGWVLGFDEHAEILHPTELRSALLSHIGGSP